MRLFRTFLSFPCFSLVHVCIQLIFLFFYHQLLHLGFVFVTAKNLFTNISDIMHLPTQEIIIIDSNFHPKHLYRIEDFFWTGSGDESQFVDDFSRTTVVLTPTLVVTTTVVSTLLVSATVFVNDTEAPGDVTTIETSTIVSCVHNCSTESVITSESINPTPTQSVINETFSESASQPSDTPYHVPDEQFWILTVLKVFEPAPSFQNFSIRNFSHSKGGWKNGTLEPSVWKTINVTGDGIVAELEVKLAILYKIAFYRQQERHLGITDSKSRSRRSSDNFLGLLPRKTEIRVKIHNVSEEERHELKLLYSVRVNDQPVLARTAANDMKLINDTEAVTYLGYEVKTKAEPYLKLDDDEDPDLIKASTLIRNRSVWIILGTICLSVFILLLLLLLLITVVKKKKLKSKLLAIRSHRYETTRQQTTSSQSGGLLRTEDTGVQTSTHFKEFSATNFHVKKIHINQVSSDDSTSCSDGSIVESPSVQNRHDWAQAEIQGDPVMSADLVDATNGVVRQTSKDITSANSYLSMPSVKAFPRGSIPEPLSKVLEPLSIKNLDDISPQWSPKKIYPIGPGKPVCRHISIEADDPGVIGPIVWNQHQEAIKHSKTEENFPANDSSNAGYVRKRFQDLLDDTFSLFGSRSITPTVSEKTADSPFLLSSRKIDESNRVKSAYPRLSSGTPSSQLASIVMPRPKTSGPRGSPLLSNLSSNVPRRAWKSGTPSPLIRPLSAGPVQVNVKRILADSRLDKNDPATHVIQSIKEELCKIDGSMAGTHTNKF